MSASVLICGLQGPELTSAERDLFTRLQPAGYILFSRNLKDAAQTRALTDSLRDLSLDTPLIGIDQEGGRVWRTRDFGASPPEAVTFSDHASFAQISTFGDLTGRLLELLGVNFNFAPVLDLAHFPDRQNGLPGRCWGRDPQEVIDKAGLFNRWMRKNNVLGCGKHFPSNGLALKDPHHDLPVAEDVTTEQLLREDILPYTALGPELDGIMACHLAFPAIDPDFPASLSKKILTGFLRNQLGYEGLILTDDLDMGAIANNYERGPDVTLAINAGSDLALICHKTETIEAAVAGAAAADPGLLDDAIRRVEEVRKKLKHPPQFTQERWDRVNDQITDLTKELTGKDRFFSNRPSNSPVEDY